MTAGVADLDHRGVVVFGPAVLTEADLVNRPDLTGGLVIKHFRVAAAAGSPVDCVSAGLAETLKI